MCRLKISFLSINNKAYISVARINKVNILIDLLLVLILSILVTACTSTDLPTWYIENVNNNQVMISGVGQGRTLSEAKKNAIEQISSQIWINVKSVSRQTDNYVSNGDSEYNDNRFYNQIDEGLVGE